MLLCRSASARGACHAKASICSPCEKRRSTSFDDSLGELARDAARIQDADATISTKKPGFWQSRLWKFIRGRKASQGTRSAIPEKEKAMPYKWRKLLPKRRSKAQDPRKPGISLSNVDRRVGLPDVILSFKREALSKSFSISGEKQQTFRSVHPPEAMPGKHRQTETPIWERRSSACPPTLDLRNIKVTGLRYLSRAQQTGV